MLSVTDLLAAGTITPDFLAYMICALRHGASFLVGARPGGAGKTTVMGAFLGLLPPGEKIFTIKGANSVQELVDCTPKCPETLLCHEIGKGSWFGYIWGPTIQNYFELTTRGYRVVSNIHADDLTEVTTQLAPFGIHIASIARVEVLIFLRVIRSNVAPTRQFRVVSVLESCYKTRRVPHYREVFRFDPRLGLQTREPSYLVLQDGAYANARQLATRLGDLPDPSLERVRREFLENTS